MTSSHKSNRDDSLIGGHTSESSSEPDHEESQLVTLKEAGGKKRLGKRQPRLNNNFLRAILSEEDEYDSPDNHSGNERRNTSVKGHQAPKSKPTAEKGRYSASYESSYSSAPDSNSKPCIAK